MSNNVVMRIQMLPILIAAALVSLSACSGETEGGSADETSPTTHDSSKASTSNASTTKATSDTKPGNESSSKTSKPDKKKTTKKPWKPDKHKAKTSKLVLKVHGQKKTIRPTQVYCKGNRGHIHHILGKTHNQPPLVKAEGKHFAMVKPGESQPYKANKPSGMSYGKDRVTFHKTSLGPATLNGTMICTKWED